MYSNWRSWDLMESVKNELNQRRSRRSLHNTERSVSKRVGQISGADDSYHHDCNPVLLHYRN